MAGTRTLTIVKPDAFGAGKAGLIIALLEKEGFTIKASRVLHMTQAEAGEFYVVHKGRPFYAEVGGIHVQRTVYATRAQSC